MAEQGAAERSERPTHERLRRARSEGQIPQSQEVPSALIILMLLVVLGMAGGMLYDWAITAFRDGLGFHYTGRMDVPGLMRILTAASLGMLLAMTPFMIGATTVSILGSLLVGGWSLSPKALKFDLSRMSPIKGFKNIISFRSVMTLLISLAKFAVILLLVRDFLKVHLNDFLMLMWITPTALLGEIGRLLYSLLSRVLVGLIIIAGIDWLYQKRHYIRQMMMTRQEIKEERRQFELAPEIRGKIRSIQIEMVRRRMLQEVPNADVVLTNPTHVAVALKYDRDTMVAPQVVAKGPDLLAQKIKEIAAANDVPVVERPELARAIYAAADVGETIPETLFVAVAEVLAMIYRMRRAKLGK